METSDTEHKVYLVPAFTTGLWHNLAARRCIIQNFYFSFSKRNPPSRVIGGKATHIYDKESN
ncbi:hypothetical protein CRD36_16740 [Paremcibacter congregatus]|uniref:Uncharacterized protein n=1 Tax=Paremcibacter congregatus TaxID=2043170 RepID=A0A2G4YLN4_9PROT|nr:hypothetical protein CRD36_16740 [Paremcibacter congregatus]